FLGRLFTRKSVSASKDPCGRVQDIIRNTGSAPMWWLRTQANYIFAIGASDIRQNLAIYWRNVFTVHLAIGVLLFSLFGVMEVASTHFSATLQPPVFQHWLSLWWWLPLGVFGIAILPLSLGFWIAPRSGLHRAYPFSALFAGIVLASGLVYALTWPGFLRYASAGLPVLFIAWLWQEFARWRLPMGEKAMAQEQ